MLKTSYYLLLLTLSLGQLTSIKRVNGSGIYLFDFILVFFVVLGFLYFLLVIRKFVVPKVFMVFVPFILFCVSSLAFSLFRYDLYEILPGILYFLRFVFYVLSGLIIYNMIKSKIITVHEIFYSVICSGVLISLLGFVQLYVLPDFTVLDESLGWDPHKNRLASTFFDPNFTGAYLVLCLALIFNKYYSQKKISAIEMVSFLVILVAVFLTFSRSAWATLAVIVFIFGYFKSKTLLLVSFLVAFSAYFAVPRVQTRLSGTTDPADSARYRIESWKKASIIAADNFYTGVGFNNYKKAQTEYGLITIDEEKSHSASGADSSLLLILATTGIMGLISYLLAYGAPVMNKGNVDVLMLGIVAGLLVNSLFINSLFYPQIMFLMFSIRSFSRISQ